MAPISLTFRPDRVEFHPVKRFSIAVVLGTAAPVMAGGMVLPIQGVHALERAGALVAGASDADALWLDPAGLGHLAGAGTQALIFDATYIYQPVGYTQPGQATVSNQQPGMGLPTLAGAIGINDRLVLAGGVTAPYAASSQYDPTGPQRYASNGIAGTELLIVSIGAAYVVSPQLRLGATVQDHVSLLDWKITGSACPNAMTCDRTFDLPMEIKENVYFAPSGSIAVQYDATDELTLGATLQAPTRISSTGTLAITPPGSLLFVNMAVTGSSATTAYTLPPTLRAGVELHRGPARVEAAIDLELWSLQTSITIEPHGIAIGTQALAAMSIARDYQTSIAASLGGEYHVGDASFGSGIGYETSAAPSGNVTVLTVDAPKLLLGLGGGYDAEGWQIGGAVGYVKLAEVDVGDPKVAELQPLHDPSAAQTFINAGTYHSYYVLAGLRAARRF